MVRISSSFRFRAALNRYSCSRDQELRFTVHESPDYLRLKVSVFNDDKKTDLIGETWVELKDVIIPGGGQSDKWHNLQCKGKYAGELRMELTYYDTRPKDEAVIERRKEAERKEARAEARQAGSRLSKQTKRRPLPADPTGNTSSRPSHSEHSNSKLQGPRANEPRPTPTPRSQRTVEQTPQTQVPRPRSSHKYETPDDLQRQWAVPPPNHHTRSNGVQHSDARDAFQQLPPDPYAAPRHVPMPMPQEYTYPSPQDYRHEQVVERRPVEVREPHYVPEQNTAYPREVYDAVSRRPIQQPPGRMAPEYGHSRENSYPPAHVPVPVHDPRVVPDNYLRNTAPILQNEIQYNSEGSGHPHRHEYALPQFHDEPEEEGPPPPPPVHRHPVSRPPPPQEQRPVNQPVPVSMPEPLNIAPGRTSPNMSHDREVPQTYVPYSPNHVNDTMPVENAPVYSASPAPSYHSERPYSRGRPTSSNGEPVPAPLVAGYNPTVVDEADEMAREYQQYAAPAQSAPPLQPMRASPAAVPAERPSSSRSFQDSVQTIPRKSVSPQPPPPTNPDSLPGIPFSPDSYDVLNPNAANAAAVRQPGANYSSPAEAMEAARQHEVDKMRALGPIVGNDGRVIDPSDHLPADTWAPEPERKTRKPEVVVRFKHSNAIGPRSAPRDQPSAQRPQSMSSHRASASTHGAYSSISDHSSRNRLQKRPQSYIPPSGSSRGIPPLRDRDNVVTYTPPHQPPTYTPREPSPNPVSRYSANQSTHSSAMAISRHYAPPIGPPVPAKVPIQPAVQSGGMDPLSEEMRRLDIGGSVGRRGRHSYAGGY